MFRLYALIGLAFYFIILILLVTKRERNSTIEEYFFAGRSLSPLTLAITFVASWWGAGAALSTADYAFNEGLGAFLYFGAPVLISTFILILLSTIIRGLPELTQGKMMERRYSLRAAKMHSWLILFYMIFNAASQMVGIGNFLSPYLDISYEFAVILGTSIVLIYSFFGGFRAVVMTDIFQFLLLGISVFVVFFVAWKKAGGYQGIILHLTPEEKTQMLDIRGGFEKYFVYIFTFGLSWSIQANIWQRVSAARNIKDARKMTILSFFLFGPLYLIVVLTGMAGFQIFPQLPKEGVVVAIIKNMLHPFMGSMVFVGIAAAIMSTMDSLLNTAALTVAYDLRKPAKNPEQQMKISRYSTLFVTICSLLIAMRFQSFLKVAWLASDLITTGAFVPLILGIFWKKGNNQGAIASMIWGFVYCGYNLLLQLGLSLPHFWELESALEVLLGMGVSLFLYLICSLLPQIRQNPKE
ncbi:MAG: sodium:solute symporter family protein [Tissierellia bacterium]|nr:sodium:solute symporter family protein [Tissierellia bacterium]